MPWRSPGPTTARPCSLRRRVAAGAGSGGPGDQFRPRRTDASRDARRARRCRRQQPKAGAQCQGLVGRAARALCGRRHAAQPQLPGHLRGAVSAPVAGDVRAARRLLRTHTGGGDPRLGLPAAHLHRLPRLLARVVHDLQEAQHAARGDRRPDRLLALPQLAFRARRTSRVGRRPGPPRSRRCRDLDGRRVQLELVAGTARLPPHAQPVSDVHARADLGAGDRAALHSTHGPARGSRRASSSPMSRWRCCSPG